MKLFYPQDDIKISIEIWNGSVQEEWPLQDKSVACVVTSPPYWGLRDYGLEPEIWGGDKNCNHIWGKSIAGAGKNNDQTAGEIQKGNKGAIGRDDRPDSNFCQLCGAWKGCLGLEPSPELYIEHIVQIFRKIREKLVDWGTAWLNLGDTYSSGIINAVPESKYAKGLIGEKLKHNAPGLSPKNLVGIPWRVAFALQADGWYLRSDIIWSKPNPMPESCTDRPTKSHEYIFLLTKKAHYFYDAEAIREPHLTQENRPDGIIRDRLYGYDSKEKKLRGYKTKPHDGGPEYEAFHGKDVNYSNGGRNKRTVWEIATQPYPGAHFATFPTNLVMPCIKAGTPIKVCAKCGKPWERIVEKGERIETGGRREKQTPNIGNPDINTGYRLTNTIGFQPTCNCNSETKKALVFDPFGGSGTVAEVAYKLGCDCVLLEKSEKYCGLARDRLEGLVKQEQLF